MTKTIYLVDPETGLFVGESVHPLDPVATERTGKPVYALLNPALATETVPPHIPSGMRARMVRGKWALEPLPPAPQPEVAVVPPPPPAPAPSTIDDRIASLRAYVQEYMDAMARSLGYDDIRTAVTYAEEPAVPKFQNEGRALRAWRSRVWAACYELLDRVKGGQAAEPSQKTLAGLLPALEIPPLAAPSPPSDETSAQALDEAQSPPITEQPTAD
ncbi:hypothetical protein [Variovorax sp. 278MFTsu5.1]|uniref:hypothetical protein n=1 Tax=Variovorax sp. 278MFTsu5.1 TaxID=3158366 RepID=UPI003AAB0202